MNTHKSKIQPQDFIAVTQNYIAAEKACGNLLPSDVKEAESLYLRALIDDHKSPVTEGKSRVSMVESLIVSRSKSRLKKIMATSPLGQAALKRQNG